MPSEPSIVQILRAAEDLLLTIDSYFRDPIWVVEHSGFSRSTKYRARMMIENKNLSEKKQVYDELSVLSLLQKSWDGKWRLVNFDIEEKERKIRDRIRSQLRNWGFRLFQRSAWVSPLPLNEHIRYLKEQIGANSKIAIIIGEFISQDPKKMVAELWEIDKWESEAEELLMKIIKQELTPELLKASFWKLILNHPRVPLDLLPQNWPLEQLVQAFTSNF